MKTKKLFIALMIICPALLLYSGNICAQIPKLYIHIVSHNEPTDTIESSAFLYNQYRNNIIQLANIVNSKNVKWNLQTSDGFVLGALQYENAGTSSTDIFETLASPPFNDNIEIDPRSKNKGGRNVADQWYLLDSCGANPTTHLGGCIYTTTNATIQPIDWWQYQNPIIGNIYGNSWQCTMLTGAGSYPPHTNDLNDFGIFKPDTTTNFYSHNPIRNLWSMGTGCPAKLDSLDDEQAIIDMIQAQVDSIQTGLWPQDRFYVSRIMTNQHSYGPLFFQKINKVIDSINAMPSSQIQWATMSEVFIEFQNWQTSTGLEYSQWNCDHALYNGIQDNPIDRSAYSLFPNPFSDMTILQTDDIWINATLTVYNSFGQMVRQVTNINGQSFTLSRDDLTYGFYFIRMTEDNNKEIGTGKFIIMD